MTNAMTPSIDENQRFNSEDGVVAINQGVDADCRLEIAAAGVVAGPLAERPFLDPVVGMDQAFEGDLRIRACRGLVTLRFAGSGQARSRLGSNLSSLIMSTRLVAS